MRCIDASTYNLSALGVDRNRRTGRRTRRPPSTRGPASRYRESAVGSPPARARQMSHLPNLLRERRRSTRFPAIACPARPAR
jgi:hypothetical protein